MPKQIDFTTDKMITGINKLADAVKITMGPKGRTVIIEKPYGAPNATKDGVTVAREVSLPDASENVGAKLIQDMAKRAGDAAGDGTTTATVICQKIIANGIDKIKVGVNPMDVKRGIDMAVATVVADIDAHATPIKSSDEIAQIATISANGDADIGAKIADAMERVGRDGVITVEEAKGIDTEIDIVTGMQFDSGFLSTYFVTDSEKMLSEMDGAKILISEKKIGGLQSLLPILEPVAQSGQSLLIIADDIESESLATLVLNRLRGGLKVCAVKAPGFGDRRKEILRDIAIITGATVISDDIGMTFENITPAVLGHAKKVIVTRDTTLITGGTGDANMVSARADEIRATILKTTSEYDREKLSERLARLVGGVAVIKVGGMTEIEVKEKRDRVEDALSATRAAAISGVVPGGGVALLRAGVSLDKLSGVNSDIDTGIEIVRESLVAPASQIIENAGDSFQAIVSKISESTDYNFGYNANTGEYGDMVEMGIIDPAKVVTTALQVAASTASVILTTGCVMVDIPSPEVEGRE